MKRNNRPVLMRLIAVLWVFLTGTLFILVRLTQSENLDGQALSLHIKILAAVFLFAFLLKLRIAIYIVYTISCGLVIWIFYSHMYSLNYRITTHYAIVSSAIPSVGYLFCVCGLFAWTKLLRIFMGFVLCASFFVFAGLLRLQMSTDKYHEIAESGKFNGMYTTTINEKNSQRVYLHGESWVRLPPQYMQQRINAIIFMHLYSLRPRDPICRQALIVNNGGHVDLLLTWSDVIAYLRKNDFRFIGADAHSKAIELLTVIFGFEFAHSEVVERDNGSRRITICFNLRKYNYENVVFDLDTLGYLSYKGRAN